MMKMKRYVFYFMTWLLVMMGAPNTVSAIDIIFGPKDMGNVIPWWGAMYEEMTYQQLYMQTDIGMSGEITNFAWENYSSSTDAGFSNVRIYMGHTSLSTLTTVFNDNYTSPPVLVLDNPVFSTGGPVDTWNNINLDTPFDYNNTDNLIIEVRWSGDDGHNVTLWYSRWDIRK
jgi:hypothetical protein